MMFIFYGSLIIIVAIIALQLVFLIADGIRFVVSLITGG